MKPSKDVLETPDAWGSSPYEKGQLFSWKHTPGVLDESLLFLQVCSLMLGGNLYLFKNLDIIDTYSIVLVSSVQYDDPLFVYFVK